MTERERERERERDRNETRRNNEVILQRDLTNLVHIRIHTHMMEIYIYI